MPLLRLGEVRVGIAPFFGELLSTVRMRNLQDSAGARETALRWETSAQRRTEKLW